MKIRVQKKNRLFEMITVVFLMFCINVTYSLFRVSYYSWLPLVVDVLGIIIYIIQYKKIKIKYIYYDMIIQYFLPLIIPSIIASITAIAIYHNSRYTMSSFKYVLWVYGAYLLGYFLIQIFDFRAIYLFLIAGTLSYITVIFKVLFFNSYEISLEVHELTYIYGILFVFFLTYNEITKNKKYIICCICLLGMFLGGKRALWLAVFVALSIYIFFRKLLKGSIKNLRFVTIICVFMAFIWVFFIKSGLFEMFCIEFNLNDMSRLKMWNYFKNDYEMSVFYWGRGLTYTDVVMSEIHSQLHISVAVPIHNFILKSYIGWGFLPFAYYFYTYICTRVIYIAKKGKLQNAWTLLVVTLVIYVNNFFGDTLLNIGTSILYGMIWSLLYPKRDNNESETSYK